MQHQQWQEFIPFYIAQTLPLHQKQAFEAHLGQCPQCQQEIDEWRMIASAVWRETDAAAQNLPPLSHEVYNRLNYRDRPPSSRFSANPPQQARRQSIRQQSQRSSVPLTMIAGITVALILGALLVGLALRDLPDENSQVVALQSGGSGGDVTQAFGGGMGSGGDVTLIPPTTLGIIPTQGSILGTGGSGRTEFSPSFTPVPFVTNTPYQTPSPLATPVPPTVAQNPIIAIQQPTTIVLPSATYTAQAPEGLAPIGSGPYITWTPNIMDNAAPWCEIFNPGNQPIGVFAQANYKAGSSGSLLPGQIVRTIVISREGWYFVVLPSLQRGWIAPESAYLRGNCTSDVLWLATPTLTPTVVGTAIIEPVSKGTVALINAAYADLYLQPDLNSAVVGVVSRGEQYAVVAYQTTGINRWIQIDLGDGRLVWIPAVTVIEYEADSIPPTMIPTPIGQ
jgi:hypothetical protein